MRTKDICDICLIQHFDPLSATPALVQCMLSVCVFNLKQNIKELGLKLIRTTQKPYLVLPKNAGLLSFQKR